MANNILEFEKPIYELAAKIEELRSFTTEKGIDFSDEIKALETKLAKMKNDIYGNLTSWQRLQIARHAERPNTRDYINSIVQDFFVLHGDRAFGEDPAILGGIGSIEGMPITVIGHLKGKNTKENLVSNFGMAHPEGYRKALRLMKQAEKFRRPILCFIDTPGAYCGIGAEERGQGEAIARNLMEMMQLKTPIVTIVIGEGGSGGALALGVGDRIFMLENTVYSVSSPEACASILWKDGSRANEAAEVLRLTAKDLLEFGVIDEIIAEPLGGAHKDGADMAKRIKEAVLRSFGELKAMTDDQLLANRYEKFRRMGKLAGE